MAMLWEVIKPGKPPAFKSPDEMWNRALEYFKWCEDNAIKEAKIFKTGDDKIIDGEVPHMRAMSQAGLCAFLNISVSTWHNYKAMDEYLEVTATIEQVMFEQKFSGAASGMLNANIIARDLGLAEKSESNVKVKEVKSFSEMYGRNPKS
jgi:hypothetical protein